MKNNGQTEENNRDSGIMSNPLSFLRSGYFYWVNASLYDRGSGGYYWSLRSASTTNSNYLGFNSTLLDPQSSSNRGYGFAVRCVALLKQSNMCYNVQVYGRELYKNSRRTST